MPLYGFCGTTVLAISIFGGVYAILPAYQADLYGSKNVGAIHGRMLLFSSTAALVGKNTYPLPPFPFPPFPCLIIGCVSTPLLNTRSGKQSLALK